ncbi:hypothetical protein AB0N05_15490 [Nocardia sp. NPDC051030]|uniref:hypothetical protein n=1 Tax=Nocardia sp. NPDC051030 TaxID=3155162 RepID=UPI00341BB39E
MRRPRAMVLDEVWRRLDGVEALSGPHGGPLRRTVKLILDPLVIRPVQNPACAGSILTADGAVLLTTRINAAADVLRATAAWFTLLKQTRRALRLTEGNAQDLYFQRCFELATVSGLPDPVRDRPAAEAALREIHNLTAGRTTQALKEYLADPIRAQELGDLVHTAWRRRPITGTPDHTPALADLLNACAAARLGLPAPEIDVQDLTDAHTGTHTGIRLWRETAAPAPELAPTAHRLGLTVHHLPQPPRVGESASKGSLGLPFDRTIHERVFTVLQATGDRADLPPIPELVDAEIARACAPWALLDESLRVAAAAGSVLAIQLRPFGAVGLGTGMIHAPSGTRTDAADGTAGSGASAADGLGVGTANGLHSSAGGGAAGSRSSGAEASARRNATDGTAAAVSDDSVVNDLREGANNGVAAAVSLDIVPGLRAGDGAVGDTAAARVINGRWQREAYVLQARRLVVRGDAPESAGPLAGIAAELRVPWRAYSRRLWVRLHGRDVREAPVFGSDELWDLLDGVARSVILDHRMRVKRALAATAVAAELDPMESRAG